MLPLVPTIFSFHSKFQKITLKITLVCSLFEVGLCVLQNAMDIFLRFWYSEQSDITYMTQIRFVTDSQKASATCGVSLLKSKSSGSKDEEKDNGHPSSTTTIHPS